MSENNTLLISEAFLSQQGEGNTTGVPSFFIRQKGCSLNCGLSNENLRFLLKNKDQANTGFKGDLEKEGKSTWTCDSAPVWLHGEATPFQVLVDKFRQENIYDWVRTGRVHLIWTGGEPTMPIHQQNAVNFVNWFKKQEAAPVSLYNEVETNGVHYMTNEFFYIINQINCSVKLSNSGMPASRRIKPDALNRIIQHKNYWFKFVISNESDMEEIIKDFIEPFNIDWKRVIVMPGLDNREQYHERTHFIMETAKKYGVIGLNRLHISGYGAVTGV